MIKETLVRPRGLEEFAYDPSLALYLPLYELDGASFASKDAHGHLCTVNQASWRPDGHYFTEDGYIDCGFRPVIKDAEQGTIIIWVKPPQRDSIFLKTGQATAPYIRLQFIDNKFGFVMRHIGAGGYPITIFSSTIPSYNTSYHLGVTQDKVAAQMYLDGTSQDHTGQTNCGEWFSDLESDENLYLGKGWAWPGYDYIGLLGECWIFNRPFTPGEMQRHCLATKWRYR